MLSENACMKSKLKLNERDVGLLHWGVHEANK